MRATKSTDLLIFLSLFCLGILCADLKIVDQLQRVERLPATLWKELRFELVTKTQYWSGTITTPWRHEGVCTTGSSAEIDWTYEEDAINGLDVSRYGGLYDDFWMSEGPRTYHSEHAFFWAIANLRGCPLLNVESLVLTITGDDFAAGSEWAERLMAGWMDLLEVMPNLKVLTFSMPHAFARDFISATARRPTWSLVPALQSVSVLRAGKGAEALADDLPNLKRLEAFAKYKHSSMLREDLIYSFSGANLTELSLYNIDHWMAQAIAAFFPSLQWLEMHCADDACHPKGKGKGKAIRHFYDFENILKPLVAGGNRARGLKKLAHILIDDFAQTGLDWESHDQNSQFIGPQCGTLLGEYETNKSSAFEKLFDIFDDYDLGIPAISIGQGWDCSTSGSSECSEYVQSYREADQRVAERRLCCGLKVTSNLDTLAESSQCPPRDLLIWEETRRFDGDGQL